MKYIKVWRRNCTVPKHHEEITLFEYGMAITNAADQNCNDDNYEDDNGNFDYEKYENRLSLECERLVADAKSEEGANCGNFYLYVRDRDFDMYDLPINN